MASKFSFKTVKVVLSLMKTFSHLWNPRILLVPKGLIPREKPWGPTFGEMCFLVFQYVDNSILELCHQNFTFRLGTTCANGWISLRITLKFERMLKVSWVNEHPGIGNQGWKEPQQS